MALRPRLQALTIAGCIAVSGAAGADPLKLADSALEPVQWSEIEGWADDDHLAAFAAYQASCQVLRKTPHAQDRGPIYGALRGLCRQNSAQPQDAAAARALGYYADNVSDYVDDPDRTNCLVRRYARFGDAPGHE